MTTESIKEIFKPTGDDFDGPDYYPLTPDEIRDLLNLAAEDKIYRSQVQSRMNQGIKGMICPRPTLETGSNITEKMILVDELFVTRYKEGGTPDLVNLFDKLLNGEEIPQ